MKLSADELRKLDENEAPDVAADVRRNPIWLIVDTVYDTYNIGGLFRLADALNVSGMYLCGDMEIPPNPRIAKASIGTYKIVPWKYFETTGEAIAHLRSLKHDEAPELQKTVQIVAVEQSETSVDYRQIQYRAPVALVVGNETHGVSPETLALCDAVAELPMWGINKSLNVIVSAAIASYHVADQLGFTPVQ